jgi:tRNA threonylcarbamoyladenosine biosynthesis protein TsaB
MSTSIGIETATEGFGVAIWHNEHSYVRELILPKGHAELVLPTLQELMHEANVFAQDIEVIGFGRGPGAFTGIRIAQAAAQGLGLGWDKPVVGVSTLVSMAYSEWLDVSGVGRPSQVVSVLDARMGEVYWSALTKQDCEQPVGIQEFVSTPDAVKPLTLEPDAWGVGHGFLSYPYLQSQLALNQVKPEALPSALAVARLALDYHRQGLSVSADQAESVYLRDQVAHVKRPKD